MSNRIIGTPMLIGYLAVFWGAVSVLTVVITSNTPPTPPELKWKEAEIFTTTKIEVEIGTESVDADGDAVRYFYTWTKNGEAFENDSRTIHEKHITGGETWEVTVTPDDGTMGGTFCFLPWRECAEMGKNDAKLTVVVKDSPPRARVRFLNPDGREVTEMPGSAAIPPKLSCMDPDDEKARMRAAEAAVKAGGTPPPPADPSQDPCTYEITWINTNNPPAEGAPPTFAGPILPAGAAKAGETWLVRGIATANGVTGATTEVKLRIK